MTGRLVARRRDRRVSELILTLLSTTLLDRLTVRLFTYVSATLPQCANATLETASQCTLSLGMTPRQRIRGLDLVPRGNVPDTVALGGEPGPAFYFEPIGDKGRCSVGVLFGRKDPSV